MIQGHILKCPTTERILDDGDPPSAIFAANDYLAIGAMTVLHKRGLRVPEDIAVIGYDDVPLAADVDPALTTVHVPLEEIGTLAAKRLLDLLAGSEAEPAPQDVIPAELIRRASA